MRKNFVLIDFENVKPASLACLTADHFEILVFVGANQSRVPFELATVMQEMAGRAKYVKIAGTGSNALDFHIAFYIGQLAVQFPDAFFHIISRDTGFDPLIAHLKSKKILSYRSPSVDEIPLVKAATPRSAEERARLFMERLERPKATRPRSAVTLSRAVAAFFQRQVDADGVTAILQAMQDLDFLSLDGSKVTYAKTSQ
ncbi:MAG: PIN domain-containing protein [Gammaproteobacteria bacterium]